MFSKTVINLFLTYLLVEQNLARILDYSECKAICSSSDDKAEFDTQAKLCKCLLKKNVDNTDIELIHKSADVLGKNIDVIESSEHEAVIIKREAEVAVTPTEVPVAAKPSEEPTIISETEENTTKAGTPVQEETENPAIKEEAENPPSKEGTESPKETEDLASKEETENSEEIVGQPRRRFHHRLVAQRRHGPRQITPEQQRHHMQQMRDHLNRLSQTTDHRARQTEIDAIRTHLRHLQQTSVIPTATQRPRSRNLVEEARRRQHRQRLLHNSRMVGATQNNDEDLLKKEVHDVHDNHLDGALIHHKAAHFDIITQDPRLVDEEQ